MFFFFVDAVSIVNIYRYLSLLVCYKVCYKLCKIDFIVYNCLCNFMHINSMINKKAGDGENYIITQVGLLQ